MRNITVVPHNPRWQEDFLRESSLLRQVFGSNLVQIFHIGSTSVEGLAAKPVIDILPVVQSLEQADACTQQLAALGYQARGELGIPGRRFFPKGGDLRTHHIHLFQAGNAYQILRHLAFRDYLRAHPQVCAQYGQLKSRLAQQFPNDIDGYCDGKDSFVQTHQRLALQWYWSRCSSR